MRRVNHVVVFLIAITLALFGVTGKAYQAQALSFHFVDEEENFVSGKYMLKGEKLYSDLFANHQPISFVFSAGVQKITNPNSVFLLIKRHREAIIFWSLVWGLILVWRFRILGLITLLIYEPLKIFLLGNLFLAESLVVYPVAYLLLWIITAKKTRVLEFIFLGFCLSLSFLLLSPLWPLLGVVTLIASWRIYKSKLRRLGLLGMLGGSLLPLLLVINFISISDYFFEVFYINLRYFIPMTSNDSWILSTAKAFASPILTFINLTNNNATSQVARILSALVILNFIILIRKGNVKFPLFAIFLLGLLNIRYVSPGEQGYSGFHIIPWFTGLIIVTGVSIKLVWENHLGKLGRLGWLGGLGILGVVLVTIIIRESGQTLFQKRDINRDFYVNYSRQVDFGEAVKIMKAQDDTLFIAPDEWLIYWQADIPHFSKMVCYYAWMSEVPEIKNPLNEKFSQDPPTYFYCDRCEQGYFGLEQFFPKYQKIVKDGKETNLMVLKEKLTRLSKEQKEMLRFYNFSVE